MPFNYRDYYATPKGRASFSWNNLRRRAGARKGDRACYEQVEVRISREAFMAWAVPEIAQFFKDHPGLTPSVDRKEPSGHYEAGNLRIVDVNQNRLMTRKNKNLVAPPGKLWCGICKQYLAIESFSVDNQRRTKRNCFCKPCNNARQRAKRQ